MIQLELNFSASSGRQCPVCGKEVVGRVDKVYCSERCKSRAKRQANPERQKAYYKAYRKANREKEKARHKAYRKANREKLNAHKKAYRQANREKMTAYHAKWRQANPEKAKAVCSRRRARRRDNGVEPTAEHRNTMANPLTRQVCHYCGKDCTGDFHWDHHIPISKGGPDAPWNLVVSCPSCNLSKSDKLPESMFCDELGLVT